MLDLQLTPAIHQQLLPDMACGRHVVSHHSHSAVDLLRFLHTYVSHLCNSDMYSLSMLLSVAMCPFPDYRHQREGHGNGSSWSHTYT